MGSARRGEEAGRTARLLFLPVAAAVLLAGASLPGVTDAASLEFPTASGGYTFVAFTATAPDGSPVPMGFSVTDDDGIPFASTYGALGGRAILGLPISSRYACGARTCQAFGLGVLRWDAAAGQVDRIDGAAPASARTAQPVDGESAAPPPAELVIPGLGLDVPLVALDAADDGSLPAPDQPDRVGWYTDTAALGEGGNMVLAGHVDWVGRQAAFRHLDALQPGDQIQVLDADGNATTYQVQDNALRDMGDPALQAGMATSGHGQPTLTLVTCGGPFDVGTRQYLQRQMVRATLVPPGP